MSPVAIHFNEKDHVLIKDFSFVIFNNDLTETSKRQSVELDLIHLFLNLKSKILNIKIPNKNKISKFAFN